MAEDTSAPVEYYLEEADTLHIPRRRLADIAHENRYHAGGEEG